MDSEKIKVLVIDDDEGIRDLVSRTLAGTEFDIRKASEGREGIQISKDYKPDVIILDIMMPNFDGFMTGKVFKRNVSTKDIPIIFVSAKKTKQDITAAIQSGGVDYIVKPFSPSNLLTKIRRIIELQRHKQRKLENNDTEIKDEKIYSRLSEEPIINITAYGEVAIFTTQLSSIVLENCRVYRDAFANIVTDGIFKIVFDTVNIKRIDGAGLALLISVNQALQKYGGELALTYPNNEINNRFSYLQLNDIFRSYNTSDEAAKLFAHEVMLNNPGKDNCLNVCLSCTYINDDDARYCGFCGTNLMVGRGKNIIDFLKRQISGKISFENANDIRTKSSKRETDFLESQIPSGFFVEVFNDNLTLSYESKHTFRNEFIEKKMIGIDAPLYNERQFNLKPGTVVRLKVAKPGMNISYETEVIFSDQTKKMIFVHYDEEATAMHLIKNFSVAPSLPISVRIIAPSFDHTETHLYGKILELSRVRATVFAEDKILEDECLAISFNLPDESEVSSPIVVAVKKKEKFMYDLEFIVIDEKERSKMIQYMFKRQIEMSKIDIQ